MGSIPTNPKPWICRRSSYRHSYGISSCPQVNAARVRARPAPPFPAPIKVGGQRAAHVHKQNQPFILCPTGQRCPHSYQSAHCCSFPGFLGLSCRFCPGQVISWQQVPSRSPGARSPAGGGAGEAGSRTEWTEAEPAPPELRIASSKRTGAFSGEFQVRPCRGRSRRAHLYQPALKQSSSRY